MALSISRRSFMKCVGITAFASATGTLMTGCSPASIVGGFGGSISLSENGGTPLANITLTGMDWSPFNISISDIEGALGIDLPGVDFNFSGISSALGFGCAMPKGRIDNASDKTLVVLPYFTTETLDEVFQELVLPLVGDYKGEIKSELEKLLSRQDVQEEVANALDTLIRNEASKIGSWLVTILDLLNSSFISNTVKKVLNEETLRRYLDAEEPQKINIGFTSIEIPGVRQWGPDIQNLIIDEIKKLIDSNLPKVSDLFRILMIQGVFDYQPKESKTDQFLNAAAAGYTLLRANTPLMINTIEPGGFKAGVLGFPSYRNWTSLDMNFTVRKLALNLDGEYDLSWETVAPLVIEAMVYLIHKNNLVKFGDPLVNVITENGLLEKMNFSIEGVTAQTTVSFQGAKI